MTAGIAARTLRDMNGQRLAMAGGALWYLLRFGLVSLLILRLAPSDPLFHLNLIWVGGQSLLVVALYARSVFDKIPRSFLTLMIIGAALAVLSDIGVSLSSSVLTVQERTGEGAAAMERMVLLMTFGILVADLLILAALISYRAMRNQSGSSEAEGAPGPRFEPTPVDEPAGGTEQ